ncbi:unnamed protein product [Adineta steineri]|uniref:Mitochondrial ATPase inhibitor n=1 Tax=Adineta steineri TaxID=433720 RepID=A0A813V117_9BILA|nr:unnamed protein product [Adineta steineri]CAF0754955.1 unnamed protein product [Adineta steineri]CAF0835150.1 unnamed protein product [Adineta steineri]
MYRALTSSNGALAQRVVRSTLTFARAASGTTPEAGSVGGGQDAFGKKEKAEETRWARRFEAEQAEKHRNKTAQGGDQPIGDAKAYGQQQAGSQNAGGFSKQRLSELEAEKRRIDQEIAELKRQKR